MDPTAVIETAPLTPDRWADFEAVMGPKGGAGGCWCMLWRLSKKDFESGAGATNRQAMKTIAAEPIPPGLLAYDGDRAVGWISVAPRQRFPRMEKSRILKPLDNKEVWSVTCLLIAGSHRRQGVATRLLEAACEFVRDNGGSIVEGYPIAPNKPFYPPIFAWTGFEGAFTKAGFETVVKRSPTRPIMRRILATG
jgi:GNAT superfamily N-acetyltransferase